MTTNALQVYLPIQQADTVFTRLLDNLYKNNDFQKNINRLELGSDNEKKKAQVIKRTVSKIRIYGDITQPLLLARDVGILMGISNIRLQLKYYNSSEKVIGLYQLNNGKTSQVEYLTWKGFIRAASNSRSAMSDVFREFIYSLVAECVNDPELLAKVSKRVIENNPEMIDKAMEEFDHNMAHYKLLYEKESLQKQLLQDGLDNEIQLRLIAESKQADAELNALMNEHNMKQMMQYKNFYEQTILNLYEWPSTNEQELTLLKRRFLKPIYIYAPHPNIYKEWAAKPEGDAAADFAQYLPEYCNRIEYIDRRIKELSATVPHENIMKCLLPESDLFYFYLHFNTMVDEKNDSILIHVGTEYVIDKKHYDAVLAEMNRDCEKLQVKKRTIYVSTLEEIHCIISQKMIEMAT